MERTKFNGFIYNGNKYPDGWLVPGGHLAYPSETCEMKHKIFKYDGLPIIDYGCCVGADYPEWMCPTCGQGYKDRHDKWNANAYTLIYSRRPKVCKKCGGEVVEIVYGYPSRETFKMAERGEIILGGCLCTT